MIDIIPAIDIIEGRCVRLSQGDYNTKKIYNENPVEQAKIFQDHGITRLHLVDLDGAKASTIKNYKVLENIATKTDLTIDFGGGIKSDSDIKIAFNSGAKMVTGGTIAVKNPEVFESWITKYGSGSIILGADAKNEMISVGGWMDDSSIPLFPFLERWIDKGIVKVISTDISRDGMLQGAATDLYVKMKSSFSKIEVIASGGIATISDVIELNNKGIDGVIIGKAIYEGRISYSDLEQFL